MKRNQKGFTVVEMVVVMVIIAILAAILIPTFAFIIRKARISNDITMAKNLNTALAIYGAENNPETVSKYSRNRYVFAYDAIIARGYKEEDLIAKTEDVYFVYEKTSNQFILIDAKTEKNNGAITVADLEVLFNLTEYNDLTVGCQAEGADFVPTWCFWVDGDERAKLETNDNIDDYATFWADEQVVYIDETLSENKTGINVKKNEVHTYNLNGHQVLKLPEDAQYKKYSLVNYGGEITITGPGTLYSTARSIYHIDGTTVLNDVTISITNQSTDYFAYVEGGEAYFNNVNINTSTRGMQVYNGGKAEFNSGSIIYKAGGSGGHMFIVVSGGELTVNSGDFKLDGSGDDYIYISDGKVTINDGNFTNIGNNKTAFIIAGGELTISGGTFEIAKSYGIASISNGGKLTITGGTFYNVDPLQYLSAEYTSEKQGDQDIWIVKPIAE